MPMAEHGFRSQIAGTLKIDPAEHIDKRTLRFMGPGAAYAHIAMEQAIADAGLTEADIVNPRTGLIAGRAGPRPRPVRGAPDVLKGQTKRIGPRGAEGMSSTSARTLPRLPRSRGSTIRSPRPARPRCIASAMRPSRS
jgi:3-oxoacyl-[acyl-carrier-protein] synthase I